MAFTEVLTFEPIHQSRIDKPEQHPLKASIKAKAKLAVELSLRNKIIAFGLTLAATISVGILSAAGALTIGSALPFLIPVIVPFAIFAFIITGSVEAQVFYNNIKSAIIKLSDRSEKFSLKKLIFLFISAMAALGFGAYTLISAAAFFPGILFVLALAIAIVSGLAFGLIVYNTLTSPNLTLANLKKTFSEHPFLFSILLIATAGLIFLTAGGWWLEAVEGFKLLLSAPLATIANILTTPFTLLGFNLFLFTNALESVMAATKFNVFDNIHSYFKSIKQLPAGQKYNPFYYGVEIINKLTAGILQIAHSGCQALIAGRGGISNFFALGAIVIGTLLDFLCDANANSVEKADEHDHAHDHAIFDSIVVGSKFVLSLPLQILAIPTDYLISLANSVFNDAPRKTFIQCLKQNYSFVIEFFKEFHHHDYNANPSTSTSPSAVAPTTGGMQSAFVALSCKPINVSALPADHSDHQPTVPAASSTPSTPRKAA